MRVLLSTIGSRGDVQPLMALAVQLEALGQEVRLCAPPDFRESIEALGIPFVPLGPTLRATGRVSASALLPTPEQRRRMVEDSVAAQFEAVSAAADQCDVIVEGGYLVLAARTVAEEMGIRYVMASYCPNFLPSLHHAPPVYPMLGEKPAVGSVDNATLWARDTQRWNDTWSALLNSHRARAKLEPVTDVRRYLFTDTPWLAADPTLAPWPQPSDLEVVQTGAWILPDDRPLTVELERFLDAGEPPVYLGFGSIRAPGNLSGNLIAAARALGRRVIVSAGWAELSLADDGTDCLSIGEVNQPALFARVATVVHHGGAGTTTAAARAAAPQVVIPQHVDQHYWAQRVEDLGIGRAHAPVAPTKDSLAAALEHALRPEVKARARIVARAVITNGAEVAARRLMNT